MAESGEPIFEVAPVDATIDYLANELGFSADEIESFVGLRAEEARAKHEALSNNPPKMMSNPIEYRQAKADWQLAVSVAEGAMNYWGDVMSAIQAGKGAQSVAEESTTAEISEAEVVQEQPTTETPIETIAESEPTSEPQPIGRGVFGNIYDQFRGKAKEAIAFLLGKKDGEAIGALHHKEIGDIDLVWGAEGTGHSDGFGLAKLVKYHPEVLDNLQEILDDMHVTSRTANRIQLESETHRASVRLTWDNQSKTWLLTAFEKRETSEPTSSSSDVASTQNESLDDTATQQSPDVSDGEVSENVSDVQAGNGGVDVNIAPDTQGVAKDVWA